MCEATVFCTKYRLRGEAESDAVRSTLKYGSLPGNKEDLKGRIGYLTTSTLASGMQAGEMTTKLTSSLVTQCINTLLSWLSSLQCDPNCRFLWK